MGAVVHATCSVGIEPTVSIWGETVVDYTRSRRDAFDLTL